jgi:peptide-methionine (S)-S-oxide reductase
MSKIVLAGGCFWGVEAYFSNLKGVTKTIVGYANGTKENPTYKEVCSGVYGFAEAIYLEYDNKVLTADKLLEHYFRIINPYLLNKQGNDVGLQYRTGIYCFTLEQRQYARLFINNYEKINQNKKTVVEVEMLTNFYNAEEYHQEYLKKNPEGYCHIDLGLLSKDERK